MFLDLYGSLNSEKQTFLLSYYYIFFIHINLSRCVPIDIVILNIRSLKLIHNVNQYINFMIFF